MNTKFFPSRPLFSLGMILVLSACLLSSPGSLGAEAPVPEMTAATPPPAAETRVDPKIEDPAGPDPGSIEVSLEVGSSATAKLGPEGGSIQTMDAQGTEYILTVPEGALFSTVEITMTPIASAKGESIGETFLAGVDLQPDNLHFLELVTIEMTGDVIEAGAIGFSSEAGGQDFHLTPSNFANGSMTITATHFSEFEVTEKAQLELFDKIAPVSLKAKTEHALAHGDDVQALSALERTIEALQDADEIMDFEGWEHWTADISNLILRLDEVIESRGWNENTPGLTEVLNEMQSLIDQWFQQSDGVIQSLAGKCVQDELDVIPRVKLINHVGWWLDVRLTLGRDEMLENWSELWKNCFTWETTWQADVVTTGSGFSSDISVGSQATHNYPDITKLINFSRTALKVEFINGFWHDTCVGTSGSTRIGLEMHWDGTSYYGGTGEISSITVLVRINDPVYIDCSPAGFHVTADAQAPFHGAALDELNKGRVRDGYWEFELEYDPATGMIGQFQEGYDEAGPRKISWSEGEYELRQLVTLYQASPAE